MNPEPGSLLPRVEKHFDGSLSARRMQPDGACGSQTGQPGSFVQVKGLPEILRADQGLKKAF
jgi:hypothetical protein